MRTPWRIHFRGFGDWGPARRHYIDLVPERIVRIIGPGAEYVGSYEDDDWNKAVKLEARLADGLPIGIAAALMQEFGVQEDVNGEIATIELGDYPRAVAAYVIQAVESRRVADFHGPVLQARLVRA